MLSSYFPGLIYHSLLKTLTQGLRTCCQASTYWTRRAWACFVASVSFTIIMRSYTSYFTNTVHVYLYRKSNSQSQDDIYHQKSFTAPQTVLRVKQLWEGECHIMMSLCTVHMLSYQNSGMRRRCLHTPAIFWTLMVSRIETTWHPKNVTCVFLSSYV